jgi:hypothetical protein
MFGLYGTFGSPNYRVTLNVWISIMSIKYKLNKFVSSFSFLVFVCVTSFIIRLFNTRNFHSNIQYDTK